MDNHVLLNDVPLDLQGIAVHKALMKNKNYQDEKDETNPGVLNVFKRKVYESSDNHIYKWYKKNI